MNVTFGKHQGKSVENLVIKEPGYIKWVIDNRKAEGGLRIIKSEAERLINIFDQKPFTKNCIGCRKELSTRVSLYYGSEDVYWWCDSCDPYISGASPGKLAIAKTYLHLLRHVEGSCGDSNDAYKRLVRNVGSLKGLPQKIGEKQLKEFFSI